MQLYIIRYEEISQNTYAFTHLDKVITVVLTSTAHSIQTWPYLCGRQKSGGLVKISRQFDIKLQKLILSVTIYICHLNTFIFNISLYFR